MGLSSERTKISSTNSVYRPRSKQRLPAALRLLGQIYGRERQAKAGRDRREQIEQKY
jgi:hypothetical protein